MQSMGKSWLKTTNTKVAAHESLKGTKYAENAATAHVP
jgi:hypothetical protein